MIISFVFDTSILNPLLSNIGVKQYSLDLVGSRRCVNSIFFYHRIDIVQLGIYNIHFPNQSSRLNTGNLKSREPKVIITTSCIASHFRKTCDSKKTLHWWKNLRPESHINSVTDLPSTGCSIWIFHLTAYH